MFILINDGKNMYLGSFMQSNYLYQRKLEVFFNLVDSDISCERLLF